jgi:hypothetical protein
MVHSKHFVLTWRPFCHSHVTIHPSGSPKIVHPKNLPAAGKFYLVELPCNFNQDKAKPFEGKYVKVMGTLDLASGTIHISDIQPA